MPGETTKTAAIPSTAIHSTGTSYLSLYAITFMVGVVMITLGPLLDPITKEFGIPLSNAGVIAVAFAVGMLIGGLALNFLFARVPAKWALIGAAWLQTAALAASGALSHSLGSLLAAYFFVGLGCVFLNSLPGMWVSSHVKEETHRAMVILLLWFAIGMAVTPIFIGVALGLGVTWRWVFIFEAILSGILALVLTGRPISDITGRKNLRWSRLRQVVSFNRPLFVTVLVASILYIGAEFILNVWLPKFEIDVFGASKTVASLAVALFWIGLIIGRLVVISLTKRYAASRLLLVGMAIMAVFALGISLSTSVEMSMVMAFLSGLGASAAYPLIVGFSGRFPAWHAGVVYSAVVMAGACGRIIFPYFIGPIAHSVSFRVAMGLAFVLAAACSLLSLYLHRVSGEGEAAGRKVAER
jgi:fucose permease